MPKLSYGVLSHTGNVRDHNEDSYFVDADRGLWVVADGMGGHEAGEVASAIVCDIISKHDKAGVSLETAIQDSHHEVVKSGKSGIGSEGMGSTVVALKTKGFDYEIAWVGDSRVYLWDGSLHQVSKDHSLVQRLLDSGVLTPETAKNHPDSNLIYQCVGTLELDDVEVDVISGEFLAHQKILLCSDGLTDEVEDEQIAEILSEGGGDQAIVEKLVQAALDNTGSDNITVALISAPEGAPDDIMVGDTQPIKTETFQIQKPESSSRNAILIISLIILLAGLAYYFLV